MRVFAASLAEMWSSRKRNRLSPDEATAELCWPDGTEPP